MTKQKKLMIIIISCVLAVALITTAVILIVANANREKTATSILTCDVNPKVQFVLNGNDKVMDVIALNGDGEEIAFSGDFVGLKAEDAAELFVKLSTEAGFIDIDDKTKVDISITGTKSDYIKIKDKIVASVNGYFDEKGIIAGAVATIEEDVKTAILDLKNNFENTENKVNSQLMDQYMEFVNLIHKKEDKKLTAIVRADSIESFLNGYEQADKTYSETVNYFEEKITETNDKIASLVDQSTLESLTSDLSKYKYNMESAQRERDSTRNNLYKIMGAASSDIAKIQENFTKNVNATADKLSAHITNFNANRASIEQQIAEYRATLQA